MIAGPLILCLYLEHLLDLLSRQVNIEFVQKLKNLADA